MLRDAGVVAVTAEAMEAAAASASAPGDARLGAAGASAPGDARLRAAGAAAAGDARLGAAGAREAREIDQQLRRIAKRKAGLEIEEARWLREAEKRRIWRKLGFSTALEYLEDVFGYAPRTAMDRLRVAKGLGDLPALEKAVERGELPYSAARELTRVMTRDTEDAWLARARGKNLRDIEELVTGRKKGDTPDAPTNPDLVTRKRTLELSPRVNAMLEQCRAVLADELGSHVDDDVLVEALCLGFLCGEKSAAREGEVRQCEMREGEVREGEVREGEMRGGDAREDETRESTSAESDNAEARAGSTPRAKAPRPVHRIVIYKCDDCSRAWQQGRGRAIELTLSELSLAECDGETVHPAGDESRPERATPNIPQRIRNRVWARDRGRCRVPGCRATRHLDIHHIHHRSEGGDHDPANLILLCAGHHRLHHEGLLAISGRAPDDLTFVRHGEVLVDARSGRETRASHSLRKHAASSKLAGATRREEAKRALVTLGFKARSAGAALDEACAHVGSEADVGTLVRAALACSGGASTHDDGAPDQLARKALVQLGFSPAVAGRAVEQAAAHVGSAVDLPGVDQGGAALVPMTGGPAQACQSAIGGRCARRGLCPRGQRRALVTVRFKARSADAALDGLCPRGQRCGSARWSERRSRAVAAQARRTMARRISWLARRSSNSVSHRHWQHALSSRRPAHVGSAVDLPGWIKDALRWCR